MPAFSAGLDIPYLIDLDREKMAKWHGVFIDTFLEITRSPLITVAAVNGTCA